MGRKNENGGKLKAVDINKKPLEIEVKELKSLSQVIDGLKEKFPGLVHWRVPVCNSASPLESDLDIMVKTLVGTAINTPVIVNDQVGLSRATTGCVIACLFKELVATMKGGAAAKNNADKIIDKNGTPKTGGTGIKQLRENIAESKLSYEIMDDAAQAFLKSKIMDNIHKYFYLIVFAGYIREAAAVAREAIDADKKSGVALPASGKCAIPASELKISKTFVDYMGENANFRDIIEAGKGNLQWERDIPPEALANLES